MSAVDFGLDNFTLFIDNNQMQSDGRSESILDVSGRYSSMLGALGFQVAEINGNDIGELYDAFMEPHKADMPKAVIGNTIKGKGVSFMEENNSWHHSRLTKAQLDDALKEVEAAR